MKNIDARGLSCPEPVVLTRNAAKSGEKNIQVTVDNPTAKENITRFATNQGYQVSVKEANGDYILSLTK